MTEGQRYLDRRLTDPEYRVAYLRTREELRVQGKLQKIREQPLSAFVEVATCPELRALYWEAHGLNPRMPLPEDFIPVDVHH